MQGALARLAQLFLGHVVYVRKALRHNCLVVSVQTSSSDKFISGELQKSEVSTRCLSYGALKKVRFKELSTLVHSHGAPKKFRFEASTKSWPYRVLLVSRSYWASRCTSYLSGQKQVRSRVGLGPAKNSGKGRYLQARSVDGSKV